MSVRITIVSAPTLVKWVCPACKEEVALPYTKVAENQPSYWGDWDIIECPECGAPCTINGFDYD